MTKLNDLTDDIEKAVSDRINLKFDEFIQHLEREKAFIAKDSVRSVRNYIDDLCSEAYSRGFEDGKKHFKGDNKKNELLKKLLEKWTW